MQVEAFRVFRDLVESQSFSKAAQMNDITQSAVSQQVRAIEKKLNVPLIERSSKRFALTKEGDMLYKASRDIMNIYDSLQHELNELRDVISGNIRVATVYSIGLHSLSGYLKKFFREFPNVNVHVEYRRSNHIYDDLLDGSTDLGLVAFPVSKKGLKVELFKKDRLTVICTPDHALAGKPEVDIPTLAREKLINFEPDQPTRRAIDRIFEDNGHEVKPVMEFDNIETVKQAVEIGAGVAIVPRASVEKEVKAGTLTMLDIKGQIHFRPLGIIYKSSRVLSPAMKRFIKTLREQPKEELAGTVAAV